MRAIRILLIIGFYLSIGTTPVWSQKIKDTCDKVEVQIETENTTSGLKNGKVKVDLVKGSNKSAKYIFCETEGRVLNENHFEKATLDGLAKGKYLCIVVTEGCSKKINFTID
ncbi:MAG TPA: hypothetical protein PLJ60_20095 [Chryseolinea sp.]|nr:hypothetical protein [Chryseolinea sp.]HPM32646.1 hypothetical protein [Chryseolinea sp.]